MSIIIDSKNPKNKDEEKIVKTIEATYEKFIKNSIKGENKCL